MYTSLLLLLLLSHFSCICLFDTLMTIIAYQPLCPWESPGKDTGVGCHALLQGNLPNPEIESAFCKMLL